MGMERCQRRVSNSNSNVNIYIAHISTILSGNGKVPEASTKMARTSRYITASWISLTVKSATQIYIVTGNDLLWEYTELLRPTWEMEEPPGSDST